MTRHHHYTFHDGKENVQIGMETKRRNFMRRPRVSPETLCETAHSKCTWYQYFTRATLCENLRENARAQGRDADFARACAVEMHLDISQEPLFAEIYRKNARAQLEHPDHAPAFTLTVNP
jgi:hypothetical protein